MNWPVGIDPIEPDDPMDPYLDQAREETDWLWAAIQADQRAIDAMDRFLNALANHGDWDSAAGELSLEIEALIETRAQTEYDGRFDL